ncbi:MAG: glycosyltransferase [Bryobacteraceae bacterium]|jgi:glycosyltransferase involved in cell wall biosynthesis
MEARRAAGPARNLIEFAVRARPEVELTIATYRRGNDSAAFLDAIRAAGIEAETIVEKRRFDLGALAQLRELVARRQPDIIQTHNVKSHLLVRWLGLWRQVPWVAFQHGYTATDWKDRLYNQCDRWSLRRAHRLVCVCGAFSERLQRWGVPASRIVVQHNPVERFVAPPPEEMERVRAELGLAGGEFLVVTVGRLSREKGHRDLLEAAAILRARQPESPVRFVIVGDGPERAALEQRSQGLGLEGAVTFAGYQANVRPYYALADVVALPSHTEGSPNVVLEALAARVAVAATRVGGVPEIVTDGETGLLIEKQDPLAMADALARLMADADLRRRLAEAGRQLVTARHSVQAHRRALVRLYSELAGKGSTEPRP